MKSVFTILWILICTNAFSQASKPSDLFTELKVNDSLLFSVGYNQCDISQFENLLSNDFEFYHDQSGPVFSKKVFIENVRDGLCKLMYKPRRELIDSTLKVYPLEKDGILYGAVQSGTHRFYALESGKPERVTSTAKFTHIWLLENGVWQLSRVYSYDHQEP